MATEQLGCPFHTGKEGADRIAIMEALGNVVNPLLTELKENVLGGGVAIDPQKNMYVGLQSYRDVREAGLQRHPYLYPEEEMGPLVAGAPGYFDHCLGATVAVAPIPDTAPLRIPVGYDRPYSQRLIRATAGVLGAAWRLSPRIREVAREGDTSELLLRHTYQGVRTRNPERALENIVCQGVVLAGQAEAFLTADPVEGYSDPDELARAVREAGLPADFTLRAGSGMLSTLVQHGRRIVNPVTKAEDGTLQLSEQVKAFERGSRKNLIEEVRAARRTVQFAREERNTMVGEAQDLLHLKTMYGANCPAAYGVREVLEGIAHVAAGLRH